MPQPNDEKSSSSRVSIFAFNGLDAARSKTANEEYSLAQKCVNLGRKRRQPLQPRLGLRPCTSSNDNERMGGECYAVGALARGNSLDIIVRLSGGRLVAVTDVEIS